MKIKSDEEKYLLHLKRKEGKDIDEALNEIERDNFYISKVKIDYRDLLKENKKLKKEVEDLKKKQNKNILPVESKVSNYTINLMLRVIKVIDDKKIISQSELIDYCLSNHNSIKPVLKVLQKIQYIKINNRGKVIIEKWKK